MGILNKSGYIAAAAACMLSMDAKAITSTLSDYLHDAISVVPNKLELSVYESVMYNDNIKNSAVNEHDSFIFKTGILADVFRTHGDLEYGVIGDVAYEYYTRFSGDMNQFDWSVLPYFKGCLDDVQNLKISISSVSNVTALEGPGAKFARHYDTGASAVYEFKASNKTGVILSGDYLYKYYTQKEFEDRTYQKMEFSVSPYYNVNSKLRTGIRAGYSQRFYDSNRINNDSYKWTINGFADYRMNPFLRLYTEAGVERKAYEGRAKDTKGDRDWNGDFQVRLTYTPHIRWTIQLNSYMRSDDSYASSRGLAYVWNNNVRVKYTATKKLDFVAFGGYEMQDEKNNAQDTGEWYASIRTNYKFSDRFAAYAAYKYNNVQYKYDGDGDYDVNEFTLGLSYKFF